MLIQNYHPENDNTKVDVMSNLRKNLDDLGLLCNKVELTLRTMLQTDIQSRDTDKFNPFPVNLDACAPTEFLPGPLPEQTISYNHYVSNVEHQIKHSEEICTILGDLCKPITRDSKM